MCRFKLFNKNNYMLSLLVPMENSYLQGERKREREREGRGEEHGGRKGGRERKREGRRREGEEEGREREGGQATLSRHGGGGGGSHELPQQVRPQSRELTLHCWIPALGACGPPVVPHRRCCYSVCLVYSLSAANNTLYATSDLHNKSLTDLPYDSCAALRYSRDICNRL